MVYNPYQKCLSCGYEWKSRTSIPKMCPRCKTRKIEISHDRDPEVIIERAFNSIRSYYNSLIDVQRRQHDGFIEKNEQVKQYKELISLILISIKQSLENDFLKEG